MLQLNFMLDELVENYPEFTLEVYSFGIHVYSKECNKYIATIFDRDIPKKMKKAVRQKIYDKVKHTLEVYYDTYKEILSLTKQTKELDETRLEFKIGNKSYYYTPRKYKFILQVENKDEDIAIDAVYELVDEEVKFRQFVIYNLEEFKITIDKLQKILYNEIVKSLQIHEEYNKLIERIRDLYTQVPPID